MEIYNSENKTLVSSDSNSAPSFEKNILTKEKQKNEINRNYLPNLSEFQQIFYETKYDKGEDKALYPNVNYKDESKKGFYIFYNNNLSGLKDLYTKELKKLKDNHPVILYHIIEFLDKLDFKFDKDSYDPLSLISKVISYNYDTTVKKARNIAKNLIQIKDIEKNYGTDIKRRVVEVKVGDNKKEIFNNLSYNEISDYPAIETNFSILAEINKDSLSYIVELDKLLNEYLKQLGENIVDINQNNRICFILNRASFYLSNKEKLREQYELDILIKLDKLRRKIDYLLLLHRFKFEENKRPILNINIERCIILNNSLETTSIYIEKIDLQKFIEELELALDRKANNLNEKKNFEIMSLNEIGKIAQVRDVNINSDENIKEEIKNMIEELEEKKEKNEAEINSIATSLGMQVVGDAIQFFSGIPPINNIIKEEKPVNTKGEKKKEGIERINELLEENKNIEKKITKNKNRLKRIKVCQNYDIEFINIYKLYKQLIKRNYLVKNDFTGIILTEKRTMVSISLKNSKKFKEQVKLREYEIKDISKEVIDLKEVEEEEVLYEEELEE